jgi:hypothetical protein
MYILADKPVTCFGAVSRQHRQYIQHRQYRQYIQYRQYVQHRQYIQYSSGCRMKHAGQTNNL